MIVLHCRHAVIDLPCDIPEIPPFSMSSVSCDIPEMLPFSMSSVSLELEKLAPGDPPETEPPPSEYLAPQSEGPPPSEIQAPYSF
jgi:hypothetical protein